MASPSSPASVLITGASRGIGAATALLAAQRGWDVAVNFARDEPSAQRIAKAVQQAGRQALVLRADVADDEQVRAMFAALDAAQAEGRIAPLRALVNNAGVVDVAQRVDEMSPQRLKRMFDINVLGSFYCAREALLRMSTAHGGPGGAIVNVSSVASRLGSAGQYVDYAAAKAAIDTFTLGQPDRARALAGQIPMGRPGTAEEIASSIVWLLSEEAAYCTGALLDVSGGR
jgi:NAD(P)-dependent dehydrogenase (short-subunit alcohol dehydrogenase family)